MPYALIDDQMYDHPKFVGLSDGAVGLWAKCLSWTARHLTDGYVPKGLPAKLCTSSARTAERYADELRQAGLWVSACNGDQFHDYHHHNPSGSAVRARRAEVSEARSQAGRKGAEARWGNSKPDSNTMATAIANPSQTHDPVPVPVPPLLTSTDSPSGRTADLPTTESGVLCEQCGCDTARPGAHQINGIDVICDHQPPTPEDYLA